MQLSISVIKPLKSLVGQVLRSIECKDEGKKWRNCKRIGLIWGRLQHYSNKQQDNGVPAPADICINCVYTVLRLQACRSR
jgi:hypothetical protein